MRIAFRSKDGDVVKFGDQFQQQSALFDTSLISPSKDGKAVGSHLSTKVLHAIQKWSEHHSEDVRSRSSFHGKFTDVGQWDQDFMRRYHDLLADITEAANYLEIPSLLDLCCRQASVSLEKKRILKLPQELQDIIGAHGLIEDLKSWAVVEAYLVLGGIHSERLAKVDKIKGNHKRPEELFDESRNGIYLCEGDKTPDIDMNQLSEITKAGRLIKDARFRVVSLPKYNRPDLVSCFVNKETTHIVIHSDAFRPLENLCDLNFRAIAIAERALKHEVENVYTSECTITWPKGSRDQLWQYRIPKAVKILKVRGLKSALGGSAIPVRFGTEEEEEGFENPLHPEMDRGHWIHELVRRFESLDELEFEYISHDDLTNLRHWLLSTKITLLSTG